MARAKNGAVPAKQAAKRQAAASADGRVEAAPEAGSGHAATSAPVVHKVVLGADAGGKPVNLLELLMEDMPAEERTTLVEAPGRFSAPVSAPARSNADSTVPMQAVGQGQRPAQSEFTAVLQAFEPAGSSALRVPTETERPRVETGGGANRAKEYTSLVESPRASPDGIGHTQVMNLSNMGEIGSNRQPASSPGVSAVAKEPALPQALRKPAPQAEPTAASAGIASWAPWLLVAIAVELLAILIVLAMKR